MNVSDFLYDTLNYHSLNYHSLNYHYIVLQVARAKDKMGLMRVLGILANAVKGHPFEDVFLHCLITSLIQVTSRHFI